LAWRLALALPRAKKQRLLHLPLSPLLQPRPLRPQQTPLLRLPPQRHLPPSEASLALAKNPLRRVFLRLPSSTGELFRFCNALNAPKQLNPVTIDHVI
jgi:hypothetical protein